MEDFHNIGKFLPLSSLLKAANEEEDFAYISNEDIEGGKEDCRKSCFGKLFNWREVNLVGIRKCLERA